MATKTYSQLQAEIEALQAQAETTRKAELADVIAKIQEAIKTYAILPQDLFGNKLGAAKSATRAKSGKPKDVSAKYSDGKGGVWVGRGPRPQWLREALASGKKLEDFLAGAVESATGSAPEAAPAVTKKVSAKKSSKASAKSKAAPAAKYRDEQGNSWTGRGPQPQWLKKGLAAGKKIEDFLA